MIPPLIFISCCCSGERSRFQESKRQSYRRLQQTLKLLTLKQLRSPNLFIIPNSSGKCTYIPNTTGCSGTQSQSSPIQSNSGACKLLSVMSGHNILTKEVKKNTVRLICISLQEIKKKIMASLETVEKDLKSFSTSFLSL